LYRAHKWMIPPVQVVEGCLYHATANTRVLESVPQVLVMYITKAARNVVVDAVSLPCSSFSSPVRHCFFGWIGLWEETVHVLPTTALIRGDPPERQAARQEGIPPTDRCWGLSYRSVGVAIDLGNLG